jgi:hypothetical protein
MVDIGYGYVVDGVPASFTEWLFGDTANELLHDHVDEFVITDSDRLVHLKCGWVHDPFSLRPWAMRASIIGHMRDRCSKMEQS